MYIVHFSNEKVAHLHLIDRVWTILSDKTEVSELRFSGQYVVTLPIIFQAAKFAKKWHSGELCAQCAEIRRAEAKSPGLHAGPWCPNYQRHTSNPTHSPDEFNKFMMGYLQGVTIIPTCNILSSRIGSYARKSPHANHHDEALV